MAHKNRMRAAVLLGPGQFCLQETAIPTPSENEIRIRLEGCGICGSNLAPWEGRDWFKYPFNPGQPGHEGWGVVDAIGPEVTRWKLGDRVAALSYNAFAEYDLVPEHSAVPFPSSIRNQPFPGEALGCAVNVFRRSDIHARQIVAIIGIGFMGALLVAMAVKAGATVIAISRRGFALELARHYGAQHTIEMIDHGTIIEKVTEITTGRGCDRVIEAVGAQWPLDLAGELTRERGKLVIAGYHQDGPRQISMQMWNWKGLDVINAHERDPQIYIDGMQAAAKAVQEGQLDPNPLYTHTFPLDRIGEGFSTMQKRPDRFLKGVVML